MTNHEEGNCFCINCCNSCLGCVCCINLCDYECKYDCNCFANCWFCNPRGCFPLFRVSIYPCVVSGCILSTTFCASNSLCILMLSCIRKSAQNIVGEPKIINPCKQCDDCALAYLWFPFWKMVNEIMCYGGCMGYENAHHTDKREIFWCTSYTCFKGTFCTEPVTVQPQAHKVPVHEVSEVHKFLFVLPSYEETPNEEFCSVEFKIEERENW